MRPIAGGAFALVLLSRMHAQATPPPQPEPVPAEMLAGVSLKLAVGDHLVLIDAPAPHWQWTHVNHRSYSCNEPNPKNPPWYIRGFDITREDRIPTRDEVQSELGSQRLRSWTTSTFPVPASIRYTWGGRRYRFVGYYTPQLLHVWCRDDDSEDARLCAKFVGSYRVVGQ